MWCRQPVRGPPIQGLSVSDVVSCYLQKVEYFHLIENATVMGAASAFLGLRLTHGRAGSRPLSFILAATEGGGDAWSKPSQLQQTTIQSERSPHVCPSPLPRDSNRSPGGGDDWPTSLRPQQTAVPSSRIAHVCFLPLAMDLNRSPSGGDDWPSSSLPQQAAVPSRRIPQLKPSPLLMEVNRSPVGGDAS